MTYEDQTKKDHKEAGTLVTDGKKPDWCFLYVPEPGGKKSSRQMCLSVDGISFNTRVMSRKQRLLETESAFGKPVKPELTSTAIQQQYAMIAACCPKLVDGNGVFTE